MFSKLFLQAFLDTAVSTLRDQLADDTQRELLGAIEILAKVGIDDVSNEDIAEAVAEAVADASRLIEKLGGVFYSPTGTTVPATS